MNVSRQLKKCQEMLKEMKDNTEENPDYYTKHGYYSMGYLEGKIHILEVWEDEINDK